MADNDAPITPTPPQRILQQITLAQMYCLFWLMILELMRCRAILGHKPSLPTLERLANEGVRLLKHGPIRLLLRALHTNRQVWCKNRSCRGRTKQ